MKSKVHIKIKNSTAKRRTILESARLLTTNLKDLQRLKEQRVIKRKKIQYLKKLLQQIKDSLKQVDIKEIQGFKTKKTLKSTQQKSTDIIPKKELTTETDQLTSDLNEIERKLNSL